MNAAIFTKPAKGLILASGLIAASSVMGYAQDAPVALGAQATVPLSSLYASAPSGIVSLGGHTFDLSGGGLTPLAHRQSGRVTGFVRSPAAAGPPVGAPNPSSLCGPTAARSAQPSFSPA